MQWMGKHILYQNTKTGPWATHQLQKTPRCLFQCAAARLWNPLSLSSSHSRCPCSTRNLLEPELRSPQTVYTTWHVSKTRLTMSWQWMGKQARYIHGQQEEEEEEGEDFGEGGRRVDGFLPDYRSIPASYLPTPFPSLFVNGMQLCHTDIYLVITNWSDHAGHGYIVRITAHCPMMTGIDDDLVYENASGILFPPEKTISLVSSWTSLARSSFDLFCCTWLVLWVFSSPWDGVN